MMAQQADERVNDRIGLRLPVALKHQLTEQARRERRSLSNLIVLKLEESLNVSGPTREDRRRGR